MAREQFELRLEESYLITPHVKHLRFTRSDNTPVSFIPGQFMNFHFQHNGEECQRSYSIATRDENSGVIEIAISEVKDGAGTEVFFAMQPGDTIMASGPFGKLVLLEDAKIKRYVLVATNTGITPYRSMLGNLSRRMHANLELKVDILLGVRTPSDLLYGGELVEFAEQHTNATFHALYTREQPSEPAGHEKQGRVQFLFPSLGLNPATDIVYLCGNPDMVDEAFTKLKEMGFDHTNVRREKYVFSH
jgi:ferredoxin-NADP reductase